MSNHHSMRNNELTRMPTEETEKPMMSDMISLVPAQTVLTRPPNSMIHIDQSSATVMTHPQSSLASALENLLVTKLCRFSNSSPELSIKATKLLFMCTGLKGSKQSEIIKRAFQVEDIVPSTGFSSYGFTAHNYDDGVFTKLNLPEIKLLKNALENFQVAFLSTLPKVMEVLKTEMETTAARGDDEQRDTVHGDDDKILLRNVLRRYQSMNSTNPSGASTSTQIGLLNLWDIGLNRSVRPFLETFNKCFTDHVALFLFINIDDVENLYAPPQVPASHHSMSLTEDFRWRPKIQYLLRPVCQLSASSSAKIKCTIFLTYDSSATSESIAEHNLKQLTSVSKMAFRQIEISEEKLELEVCKIAHNEDCKLLLEKMQLITKEMDKTSNIPVSHLLLRYVLVHAFQEKVCITREELQDIAKRYAQMEEADVAVFCKSFTAFGSILDVSLVNPNINSNYVIIKPNEFLVHLQEYIHKINEDDTVQTSPSVSESEKQIVDVLVDMGMAYTYTDGSGKSLLKLSSAFAFKKHEKHHKEKAIQFVVNMGTPRLNLNIDLMKYLTTHAFPDHEIFHGAANSTIIRVPQQVVQGVKDHIDISFTFLANVIEISFQVTKNITSRAHVRPVCSEVIAAFKQIVLEKHKKFERQFIKYHFAILCKEDEIRDGEHGDFVMFNAYRIRHILPEKLCEECHKVWSKDETSLMIVDEWNQLLEQGKDEKTNQRYAIPHELKLNGDLSVDNIAMLSKSLAKFHWRSVKILANELGVMIVKQEPEGLHRKEFTILTMLVHWEHDNHRHKSDSLRKIMAWKLHDAAAKCRELVGNYKDDNNAEKKKKSNLLDTILTPAARDFEKLAMDLDMTVLTKKQRDEVVESVIRGLSCPKKTFDPSKTTSDIDVRAFQS